MNIIPYNKYILVLPNGDIKGVNNLVIAKEYTHRYYDNQSYVHSDFTNSVGHSSSNMSHHTNIQNNTCEVYDTQSVINALRVNGYFQVEVEPIVSNLLEKDIKLNINEYSMNDILNDAKKINYI